MVLLKRAQAATQIHASACHRNNMVQHVEFSGSPFAVNNSSQQLQNSYFATRHHTNHRSTTVNTQNHIWMFDWRKPVRWLVYSGCFSNILYLCLQQAAWDNRPCNQGNTWANTCVSKLSADRNSGRGQEGRTWKVRQKVFFVGPCLSLCSLVTGGW